MELKNVEIIKIGEAQEFASGFRKVEWVVKVEDGEYSQEILLQSTQDKVDDFLKYNKVGQKVDVSFNLRGRSWLKDGDSEDNRKWFNSLDVWKVFKSDEDGSSSTSIDNSNTEEDDDLPF